VFDGWNVSPASICPAKRLIVTNEIIPVGELNCMCVPSAANPAIPSRPLRDEGA
jgi:hypothetical protein